MNDQGKHRHSRVPETGAFVRGASIALTARIAGAFATLLLYWILTRAIGSASYGRYVVSVTWVDLLAALALLGLDAVSLRYVSTYTAEGRWSLLAGFLRYSRRAALRSSLVVAAALVVGTVVLRDRLSDELAQSFVLGAALVPVLASLLLTAAQLRGRKRMAAATLPSMFLRPAGLCLLTPLISMISVIPDSAASVIAAELVVVSGLLAVSGGLLQKGLFPAVRTAEPRMEAPRWRRMGLTMLAVAGSRLFMNRTDIIMLGALQDASLAGTYALASRMALAVGLPLMAANSIAAPLYAERHASGDRDRLQGLVTFATRSVTAAAFVTALVVLGTAPWVLRWFGPVFGTAYVPLVVLVVGQLVNAACGAVGFLLAMTAYEQVAARVTVLATIANVALNALLIPAFGQTGAAAATLVAGAAWNLILVWQVRKSLGIHPTLLAR